MSGKVQALDTIGPLAQSKTTSASDPARVDYEEGKKCLEDGNYGQAAISLHNALMGFQEKNDQNGIANASNQLGHLCLAKEEFESALTHYEKAFEICDKSNDRMSILAVLKKMVDVHMGLGKPGQAIDTCLDMLDHYHDNRDPQGTVATLEKMAEIYVESGDNAKAADSYRTISSIHKSYKHDNIAAEFLEKASKLES